MVEFLEGYLWPMIKELSRPKVWKHQPSDKQRSAVHKYSGLNNLGNICYMISMLQ
jgi:ubiquitin C-terminal hydrolase